MNLKFSSNNNQSFKLFYFLIFIAVVSLIVLLVLLFSNLRTDDKNIVRSIQASLEVYSFNESVRKADLIAKVKIKNKINEINEPSAATIFSADIIDTYKRGSAFQEINILQHGNSQWIFNGNPLFQRGEELILFLMKHSELDNTYWILGEETNFFKVDNGLVIKPRRNYQELQTISINLDQISVGKKGTGVQFFQENQLTQRIKQAVKIGMEN